MRRVVQLIALAATAAVAAGGADPPARRVLVLGIDGMDPVLLQSLMEEGRMPAFTRLAGGGSFSALRTTAPPQSPVAWASFICGAGPGTHELYDFVHRAPGDGALPVMPYLSTSRVDPPRRDWSIGWGRWRIPLFGSRPRLLRRGEAFWDSLLRAGVDVTIYRVPANYPPPEAPGGARFRCLCGMGTPDLLGTYGLFTFFGPDVPAAGRSVSGGRFERLDMHGDRGTAVLKGPPNFLRRPEGGRVPPMTVRIEIVRDPEAPVAGLTVGDTMVVLNEGEWSGWIPVEFRTGIPASGVLSAAGLETSARGMVRVHLQRVHPDVSLYVSPINVDPLEPATPIAAPGDFAGDVARRAGRYYTTGIPEDTKALRAEALDEDQFLAQVRLLEAERVRQYREALAHFDRGLLFFYFGHIDQLSHIFWRDRDPDHPAHDPQEAAKYGTVVEDAYVRTDALLAEAMEVLDDGDALIVMSDHGFASFRRGFHLNAWLHRHGYLAVRNPMRHDRPFLQDVDWSATRAYGLGLNALYLNVAGREPRGIVSPGEAPALARQLAQELAAAGDDGGRPVIDVVHVVSELYPGADPAVAPDLLVGYAAGYRASWETAEGGVAEALLEDNHDRWSGDHCIAAHHVPGVLVTNRRLVAADPGLTDLAPTILAEFGVAPPGSMTGRVVLERE